MAIPTLNGLRPRRIVSHGQNCCETRRNRVAVVWVGVKRPRVEATLGFGSQPLRGDRVQPSKNQTTKFQVQAQNSQPEKKPSHFLLRNKLTTSRSSWQLKTRSNSA